MRRATIRSSASNSGRRRAGPNPAMPTSVPWTSDVPNQPPKTPWLETVNVPPASSAGERRRCLADSPRRASSAAMSSSGLLVGVADHRQHEAVGGVDGDAEVAVRVQHDLPGGDVDARVEHRVLDEGERRRLDEERRQRHRHAAACGDRLELLAQREQVGDVDLVERVDVRHGVPRRGHRSRRCACAHRAGRCAIRPPGDALVTASVGVAGDERRRSSRRRLTSASTIRPPGPLPVTVGEVDAQLAGEGPRRRRGERSVASGRPGRRHRRRPGRSWHVRSPATRPSVGRPVAVAALAAPSSTTRSTSPTEITAPTSPPRATTVPVTGAGISTTALSVSISTTGWSSTTWSPTATSHDTISASVNPSPMSTRRNSCFTAQILRGAADGGDHALDGRHVVVLDERHRIRHVPARTRERSAPGG